MEKKIILNLGVILFMITFCSQAEGFTSYIFENESLNLDATSSQEDINPFLPEHSDEPYFILPYPEGGLEALVDETDLSIYAQSDGKYGNLFRIESWTHFVKLPEESESPGMISIQFPLKNALLWWHPNKRRTTIKVPDSFDKGASYLAFYVGGEKGGEDVKIILHYENNKPGIKKEGATLTTSPLQIQDLPNLKKSPNQGLQLVVLNLDKLRPNYGGRLEFFEIRIRVFSKIFIGHISLIGESLSH